MRHSSHSTPTQAKKKKKEKKKKKKKEKKESAEPPKDVPPEQLAFAAKPTNGEIRAMQAQRRAEKGGKGGQGGKGGKGGEKRPRAIADRLGKKQDDDSDGPAPKRQALKADPEADKAWKQELETLRETNKKRKADQVTQ